MLLIALLGVLIGCPNESKEKVSEKPRPKVSPKPEVHVSASKEPDAEANSEQASLTKWMLSVQRRKGWETERKADNTNAQIRGIFLGEKKLYLAVPRHFATTTTPGPADKVFLQQFGSERLEMDRTLIGKSEGFEVWKVDRPEFIKRFQFTFQIGEAIEWG